MKFVEEKPKKAIKPTLFKNLKKGDLFVYGGNRFMINQSDIMMKTGIFSRPGEILGDNVVYLFSGEKDKIGENDPVTKLYGTLHWTKSLK